VDKEKIMPVYEYECEECKHLWEENQKMNDPKITICPKCKKESAKRLISGGTGFILVGGCWSKDNYNSK
jgi:putative FmdB family regulatory protein